MSRKLAIVISILLIASATRVHGQTPLKVGLSLGLTGRYQEMGQMQQMGFRLWAEQVNQRGGLLAPPLQLIIYDDHSNRDTAVQLYGKLLNEDRVDFVFGPYSSGLTDAILPITAKRDYPVLASGASSDKLWEQGYTHLFGIYTPASRYTMGFLEMAAMNGLAKVAIASADDPFSAYIAKGTGQWARNFGLQVVISRQFCKGSADYSHFIHQAQRDGAEMVIMCGHYDEAVNMRLALQKSAWTPKAFYASVGPALPRYYQELHSDAELVFSSSQWEPGVVYQPNDKALFLEPFMKKYAMLPSYQAAAAFAAGQILESAIQKAGSIDRRKVRDMLATMDAVSIIGRYAVDETGKQIKHFPVTTQWQQGKNQIVWPKDLATATPIFK